MIELFPQHIKFFFVLTVLFLMLNIVFELLSDVAMAMGDILLRRKIINRNISHLTPFHTVLYSVIFILSEYVLLDGETRLLNVSIFIISYYLSALLCRVKAVKMLIKSLSRIFTGAIKLCHNVIRIVLFPLTKIIGIFSKNKVQKSEKRANNNFNPT